MNNEERERKEKAAEILSQLGGHKFIAMTGAYNIFYDGSLSTANLSLKFKGSRKANYLKITDDGLDTYTVTFCQIRGAGCKVVSEHEGIYNDMLQALFTEVTGLYTTLGTMGA